MKKKFSLILLFFSFVSCIFANEGMMWETKKLNVIKTEWFDIIYPQECEVSAKLLYQNADAMLKEISEAYNTEPHFRMPVVICPYVEQFNAYWSNSYTNHIVLYDTSSVESLLVFSEQFLSTFRHELTHAVTYNLKGPFWSWTTKVFGDPLYIPGYQVSSGWAEGATVSMESAAGEGRLNDEYAKQPVKQAKIENEFPKYWQETGSSDIYPSGSFYNFNGAFDQWLQQKYGMEKYAELWWTMVNIRSFTVFTSFKKVYGKKLKVAWAEFADEYKIPDDIKEPLATGFASDFFEPDSKTYSEKNDAGSIYVSLTASDDKIFYIDNMTSSVYRVSKNQFGDENVKPEKLFTLKGLSDIRASADGKYLSVSSYDYNKPALKLQISVYDVETKQLFKIKETGKKLGSIIKNGNDYYVICQKFKSQFCSIEALKLIFDDGKITDIQSVSEIPFGLNEYVYDFTDLQNGTFAFIKKSGLDFSICTSNINGQILSCWKTPFERMVMRDLFYNDGKLYFSWTVPEKMPCLGIFNLENSEFELAGEQLSGGVYTPVIFDDVLIYTGNFFRQNRILKTSIDSFKFENIASVSTAGISDDEKSEVDDIVLEPENYNPFKYIRGLWLPFSSLSSVSYDPEHESSYGLPIGVTYMFSNPWDGNEIQISAGYGLITKSGALQVSYSGGTNSSVLNYSLLNQMEFDSYGFKQEEVSASLSSAVLLGKNLVGGVGERVFLHYGRSNLQSPASSKEVFGFGGAINPDLSNYICAQNITTLSLRNVKFTGPGLYEKIGWQIKAQLSYSYNAKTGENKEIYANGMDLGFQALFYIPKMLPVRQKMRSVTNLPAKLYVSLFEPVPFPSSIGLLNGMTVLSDSYRFPFYNMASVLAEVVLYEKDIQNAISWFPILFFYNFRITFDFVYGLDYTESIKYQSWHIAHLNEYCSLIKNGELVHSGYPYFKFDLGFSINNGAGKKNDLCVVLGFPDIMKLSFVPACDIYLDIAF